MIVILATGRNVPRTKPGASQNDRASVTSMTCWHRRTNVGLPNMIRHAYGNRTKRWKGYPQASDGIQGIALLPAQ